MDSGSTDRVEGVFPNDAANKRPVGGLLLEEDEHWQLEGQRMFFANPWFQESCHPCDQYTRGLEDMTNASLQRGCKG